jgi:cytochrome P450
MNESAEPVQFNPLDASFRADPYPQYKALYSGPPLILNLFIPLIPVARYRDLVAVLRDHERFSSVPPRQFANPEDLKVTGNAPTLVSSDPPVHTRLRRLVSRAFSPARIRAMEPRIRQIAAELLDRVAELGAFEVMEDFAVPLPVRIIAEMLGVDPANYQQFREWSNTLIDSSNRSGPGAPMAPNIRRAFIELRDYFGVEIERRRRTPGDDLISLLVAAHDEAEALSADELMGFVILLLIAGNETTTNLIGNGMLALARNPDQLELLARNPDLLPSAIEEMLRYDSPVQSTLRVAKSDTEVGGTSVPAGALMFTLVGAGNRDPAQFPEPDRFDVAREPNDHLAFGEGIHFCLGASLARLEAQVAFSEVLARFSHFRLANPGVKLQYRGSFFVRGLTELRIAV